MRAGKLTPEMEARKWRPGESGNVSGRPKKRPISDSYLALAEQEMPEELCVSLRLKKGATYRDAIALGQIRSAIKGKTEAAREIREAIEGKVTQRIALTDSDGDDLPAAGDGPGEFAQRLSELTDAIRDRLAQRKGTG
jgi:hypothetical protein